MPESNEYPLATPQSLAAFTVAALFWGVGVAMIDPRIGVGVLLCAIGVAATSWLFWASIKSIPRTPARSWPWLGLGLLVLEISIPTYMVYARADQPEKIGHTEPSPSPLPDAINRGGTGSGINGGGGGVNGSGGGGGGAGLTSGGGGGGGGGAVFLPNGAVILPGTGGTGGDIGPGAKGGQGGSPGGFVPPQAPANLKSPKK